VINSVNGRVREGGRVPAEHEQLRFPELVDIEAAAKLLCVSVRHMRRFIAENTIPYLKIGGSLRFDKEELRKWIEKRWHRPPGEETSAE
jgi:excisionase family DNA binding protein